MKKIYTYSKDKRIRDKKEVRRVLREGDFYTASYLKVFYLPFKDQKFSVRLEGGIKGGYRRNRLRRRIREVLRREGSELKNGLYVVMGKRDSLEAGYRQIKESFERVIEEADLWQN